MKQRTALAILIGLLGVLGPLIVAAIAGQPKTPIPVAAIFSITGPAAKSNAPSILGVRFAVDEINREGGINGQPIRLLLFDNRSTPIGSKVAADRAVAAKVAAIIGAAWSSHSIAVAQVAQAEQIPMISNISTSSKVTQVGDYIFRVCFIDPFQGRVMAHFARNELKAETASILVDITSDYSMGLAREFALNFVKQGGRLLQQLYYKQKQDDLSEMFTPLRQSQPDVLFVPGHDESGRIIREAQEAGVHPIFMGGDGWDPSSFLEKGGNRLKLSYYCTHWSPEVENPVSRRFVARYQQMIDVNANTALGYDAVWLLANAIGRAGALEGNKIRDALAVTRDFHGVTGTISLNRQGDPIKSAVIIKIEDGKPAFHKVVNP